MNRDRFFIENEGEHLMPIKKAIEYVVNENETNSGNDIIYLVILTEEFRRNLWDIGLINSQTTKTFQINRFSFEIITLNQILKKISLENTIVISVWIDNENLFKIEEIVGLKTIIGIPWIKTSLDLWTNTFGPFEIESRQRLAYKTITDEKLRLSFDNLTRDVINWTTLHSNDISTIKHIIKNNKQVVDPLEIFTYLRREKKLNYKRCMEIMEWSRDLIDGKRVKI